MQRGKDGLQIYPADGGKALPGHGAKKKADQKGHKEERALPPASEKREPPASGRRLCAWKTEPENRPNSMPSAARSLTILSMGVNFCEPIAGELVNAPPVMPLFQKELKEQAITAAWREVVQRLANRGRVSC